MSENTPTYVVVHGLHTSSKTAVDYVADIVYGSPKIDVVLVGSRFVAILEYADTSKGERVGSGFAQATFERMGSFPHGASLTFDIDVALREFGVWVRHYAPGTIVGIEAA